MPQTIFIVFSNLGLGGIQKKIIDILATLEKKYPLVRITLVLRRKEQFDLSFQITHPHVRILIYSEASKIKTPFFFTFYLIYQIWKENPDAALTFLSPFSLPTLLAKIIFWHRKMRVVINEDHFTSGIIPYYRYSWINSLGIRLLYPFADAIISPTKAAKQDLVKTFGIMPQKIIIVPNWTNLAKKSVIQRQKKYDLIYAGRFVKTKRVDFLLQAILKLKNRNKNFTLCLVGDGEEKPKLEHFVRENKLQKNVAFLGAVRDVSTYLGQSKIFVCASQYGAEGFPLAVLEAMAAKIPVLTYRFAGVTDVIKHKQNGFIFTSMDSFIDMILLIATNHQTRARVARQAKIFVSKFHSLANINYYLSALHIEPT